MGRMANQYLCGKAAFKWNIKFKYFVVVIMLASLLVALMLHVKMARLVNFFATSSLVISHHVLCETFDIDFIVNTHCQICSLIPVIVNVTSVYFLI